MTSSGSETGNGRLLARIRLEELGLLDEFMLCREIMAVCSEIHTKHINTLCGQNVELMNVKLVVHIVTTGL